MNSNKLILLGRLNYLLNFGDLDKKFKVTTLLACIVGIVKMSLSASQSSALFLHLPIDMKTVFPEENYDPPPNPPIGSGDRVQTRLIFTVFIVCWPWKLGQGHQI